MPTANARIVAVVGVTALLPLLTGCSDEEAAEAAAMPSTLSSASPPPVSAYNSPTAESEADQDAVKAYEGMIDTWVDAARTSNAGSPALRRYARGQALKVMVDGLYSAKIRKLMAKGAPVTSPKSVDTRPATSPTDVVVQDCFDTTNWLLYKMTTGELAGDTPGSRQQFKAVVRKADGVWKVDGLVSTGSC